MRSISSGVILVLVALQLAHSATVSDKYNNLPAEERQVAAFGGENAPHDAFHDEQNDPNQLKTRASYEDFVNWHGLYTPGSIAQRVRSKRQVDNSETFSDATDTSRNMRPLPFETSDDAVQNSDENNDDDYVFLDNNSDAEDIDDGKTVEDKVVKEEPKMMEMNKKIDVSSGTTDIPDSEEAESQASSKIDVSSDTADIPDSEEAESQASSKAILEEQAVKYEESKLDEKLDQGTKSDENVQSKAITTEEYRQLGETNVDPSMATDDVILENANASEPDEYENSGEDEKSTGKADTSELLGQVRTIADVEILPADIKTSEASSKADIKEELKNGEGSGDSDEADSLENESGEDSVEGSGEFKNMSVNAQDKNVVVTNPVKTFPENDPLNLDDKSFSDDDDDEPPIEVPEEGTNVYSAVVDDKHEMHTVDEIPISDPTRKFSGTRIINVDTSEKESDSKATEDADNMKLDELLIVPVMPTTVKNIEGSASGDINLDDVDDSSEDFVEGPAVLTRGVVPMQPPQSSQETKEDPDQSADVARPITELSVTGEEVPDSDNTKEAIEEPIVAVNVNKLNAIPGEGIIGGKTHSNISTDVERDEDMSKIRESINEIGVKTDEKAASTPESDDTSISSGSFIILGAIMVAIVALLGYTLLKSRRQKQRQRDARKAKEDDPGTELKLITPHQNGNGPSNGIAEAERLLSSNGDYDDTKPVAGTQNKYGNGDITAGMDQTIRVNMSPKMANGNSVISANGQPGQVHNQPMEEPRIDAVAVDLRYVPDAATPSATADVMQSPSGSSCSLNSVDDRGSWVYGTTPLETTKIKMFIDEDSIPKMPIVIEKRGGVTVDA